MEFLLSFPRRHLAEKPVGASPNIGCFLRLNLCRASQPASPGHAIGHSLAVNNERAVRTLKPSSEQNNALREFLRGQKLNCKFASFFQSLQMHCRVFCNLAYSSNVKQIRKSWCHGQKKNNYTHVVIQVQTFRRKRKNWKLFSRNKKALRLKQR